MRFAPVMTGEGGILPKMTLPFRLFVGGRLGGGGQWMSWVSLDDALAAVDFVVGRDDLAGPVNVTSPQPVTNAEMTTAIGRALHRPSLLTAPAFALRLALGREMADSLLLVSQRVHPDVLVAAGYEVAHPDIDSALAVALGNRS